MVGQRLRSYIESRGLEPEDIPRVVGTFVAAKYITLCTSIVLGARYQPLRRLFPRKKARSGWEWIKDRFFANQNAAREEELGRRWAGWYTWAAEKYWYMSDKLQASAESNRFWRGAIERAGGDPKAVALGVAEGTILCKVTFPLWGPLELLLIVKAFQLRRRALQAGDSLLPDEAAKEADEEVPNLGDLLDDYDDEVLVDGAKVRCFELDA